MIDADLADAGQPHRLALMRSTMVTNSAAFRGSMESPVLIEVPTMRAIGAHRLREGIADLR